MFGIPGPIGTVLDLLVVIFGFGLIIFIHELGHFVAARWAKIRVLAFALGFGPAMVSYRKGMGWTRGTSEPRYLSLLSRGEAGGISSTEYRLNTLPLGGYVKMLGQEDLDPGAVSGEPDSYQSAKPWKRMVVISAGVVMNLITAAILFVVVFMVGLKVEPPKIGQVEPNSPAAQAVAINASEIGIVQPGLQPGDVVIEINGRQPKSYSDLLVEVAMTARNEPARLSIARPGIASPLTFEVRPEPGRLDRLLSIGVSPAMSSTLRSWRGEDAERAIESIGLAGVKPGMRLISVAGQTDIASYHDLLAACAASGGEPVRVTFANDAETVEIELTPASQLQTAFVPGSEKDAVSVIEHILGLTPVIAVAPGEDSVTSAAHEAGLRPGDIFARIGSVEFPSIASGIREVRLHRNKMIDVVVLRDVNGVMTSLPLTTKVTSEGRIGFNASDTRAMNTLLSLPPTQMREPNATDWSPSPASSAILTSGQRIVEVNGTKVSNFSELRSALQDATREAAATESSATVRLTLEWFALAGDRPRVEREWAIAAADVAALHALTWVPPFRAELFEPEQVLLQAATPLEAVRTGLSETRRVLISTYITFARLFQQTVKIEHIKGPVGIAHMGTIIAERGFIWILFFMAIISVNLAVINFLPLPIVDGGQFLMIVYEQIRGKPVPIVFQNVVTMAGLILIVSLFLVVTFNDVKNLFGL